MKILWVHNFPNRSWGMFMWDILDALRGRGLAIEEMPVSVSPRLGALYAWIDQVRRAARDADIVHAQYGSLVGLLSLFSGKPLILSLRGSDVYYHAGTRPKEALGSLLRVGFSYVAALGARGIVVMSDRMRKDVRRWPFLNRKPIVVITDPVGDMFWPEAGPLAEAPLRIFFASLQANNSIKRGWLIDEAIEICRAAGLPIEVEVVVGRPREEVMARIRTCDVVALASTHEGWPNVVKEALVNGLNFVATDVSDLSRLADPASGNIIVDARKESFALAFARMSTAKAWRLAGRPARYCDLSTESVARQHAVLYAAMRPTTGERAV